MSPSRSPTRGAGVSPERLPPPVQQAHRRGTGRDGGPRPRARHLQGAHRGARRPHPGREPRRRPRRSRSRCRSREAGARAASHAAVPPVPPCTRRAAEHPRGRPRPADPALRPRRAFRARLAPRCSPGTPHDLPRIIRTETRRLVLLDLMLPDVDGIELMRQIPELADLPGSSSSPPTAATRPLRRRSSRPRPTHRQALLADGAGGVGPGGAQTPRGPRAARARRAFGLRAAPSDGRRGGGRVDGHRVRAPARADSAASPAYIFNHRGVGYRMAKPPDR